jgi:L-2-hydroxyglutarate oxidase LhgO
MKGNGQLFYNSKVIEIKKDYIVLENGKRYDGDKIIVCNNGVGF